MKALEAIGVKKHYGGAASGVNALHGINLAILEGEFVAIVGPSGSGKSTLLNILGALDRPSAGKVFIAGADLNRMNNLTLAKLRNKRIGFVFQSFNLIPRMTAAENVALPMLIRGSGPGERKRRAVKLLDQLGIASHAESRPGELSGGEQQRVAVARALANNPSLILADEPTGNLDTKSSELMMGVFQNLNSISKKTIVMITHNLELAKKAGRIVSIKDGTIEKEERLK